jgi:Tfp pilus assembly protein PilX
MTVMKSIQRRSILPAPVAMKPIRCISRLLASERGFTMVVTLGVLLVSSLLLTAAFVGAGGDIHLTQRDTETKKAYYAALAGIENYEYHLTQDGNYLNYCTTPTSENPALNQLNKKGTETPLKASELGTAEVPPGPKGESSGEKYAIQLLPAESDKLEGGKNKKCDTNNVVESMIEQEAKSGVAGTFRIQSTGFAEGKKRTVVATFRNLNFVSFVWYSMYETGDSVLYGKGGPECDHFYGERSPCTAFDNYFITGESVNGPMHTEDHLRICGVPKFGRNENDRIEFGNGKNKAAGVKGYSTEGCGGEPEFKGTLIPPSEVKPIQPPPDNEELEHIVEPAYEYEGKTEIILTGETMTVRKKITYNAVTKKNEPATEEKGVAFPPNGVIYVSNEGSCELYSPFGPVPSYTGDSLCGNVYVHGEYKKPLTIAAQNDVIINSNITTPVNGEGKPSTNALLGLIANNFVRVYHPLTGAREKTFTHCGKPAATNDTTEAPEDLKNPEIYAAILAVKHSFIVDNFDCGKPELGQIKIYGAIAGLFTNGMTGVFSGKTVLSGYGYNLEYDNRLEVAEPPHFLNPIEAAWYVQRETLANTP